MGLIWKDNITDLGKSKGYIELLSEVAHMNIDFSIRNWKYFPDSPENKIYMISTLSKICEFESIDSAKKRAEEIINSLTQRPE